MTIYFHNSHIPFWLEQTEIYAFLSVECLICIVFRNNTVKRLPNIRKCVSSFSSKSANCNLVVYFVYGLKKRFEELIEQASKNKKVTPIDNHHLWRIVHLEMFSCMTDKFSVSICHGNLLLLCHILNKQRSPDQINKVIKRNKIVMIKRINQMKLSIYLNKSNNKRSEKWPRIQKNRSTKHNIVQFWCHFSCDSKISMCVCMCFIHRKSHERSRR